ncbi:MAG: hypothetical protein ABEJ70_06185 [Halobacteriaceae archaeon]
MSASDAGRLRALWFGDDDATGAASRLALWVGAAAVAVLWALWLARPDAAVLGPVHAALLVVALVAGVSNAARGGGLLATTLLVAAPAVGYVAAAVLAPVVGVVPPVADLTDLGVAVLVAGYAAAGTALAHAVGAALGWGRRRVRADSGTTDRPA